MSVLHKHIVRENDYLPSYPMGAFYIAETSYNGHIILLINTRSDHVLFSAGNPRTT